MKKAFTNGAACWFVDKDAISIDLCDDCLKNKI